MSRRKKDAPPEPVENLGLFSDSETFSEDPREKPEEEQEAAPPGTREKLSMRPPADDGKPAKRRLRSLEVAAGYRVELEVTTRKLVKGVVRETSVPARVSIRPMDRRSWWRLADKPGTPNPLMELEREEAEEPPRGNQWDETSNQTNG